MMLNELVKDQSTTRVIYFTQIISSYQALCTISAGYMWRILVEDVEETLAHFDT